jgi:predicted MPP superfamily phosphohydrolase
MLKVSTLIFFAVVTSVAGLLHYYISRRLFRDPQWPAPWSRRGTWAIWSLMALMIATMLLSRMVPRELFSPFAWLTYSWMGTFWFLFCLLAVADIFLLLSRLGRRFHIGAARRGEEVDLDRRSFFSRAVASSAGVGALGLSAYGVQEALNGIELKELEVWIANLEPEHDGYTIVQISDVHVGPTIGKSFIRDLVTRINAQSADLIAITGDLVDGSVENLGEHVAPLGDLRAKDGVYFVTGNHEYFSGVRPWIEFLGSLSIRVLRNECVELPAISLLGVDDSHADRFDPEHGEDVEKAAQMAPKGKPRILLAHQPRAIFAACQHEVDLQLSGHTHGGQLFPFSFFVKLQQPYVAGHFWHEKTQIYVSRGTGYWGPPMRVGAPAEITKIRLRAGMKPVVG